MVDTMNGQLKYCAGCRNDYYNHDGNGFNGKGCWSLEDSKVVTRYRIHWWTAPTVPGAYVKVRTNDCHHESLIALAGTGLLTGPPMVAATVGQDGRRSDG